MNGGEKTKSTTVNDWEKEHISDCEESWKKTRIIKNYKIKIDGKLSSVKRDFDSGLIWMYSRIRYILVLYKKWNNYNSIQFWMLIPNFFIFFGLISNSKSNYKIVFSLSLIMQLDKSLCSDKNSAIKKIYTFA